MSWHIGRTEALTDPAGARRKALERLRGLAELDDPEGLVVPILLDALLMVESYRGARHLPVAPGPGARPRRSRARSRDPRQARLSELHRRR